jgi:FkbM family methyltransferase
VIRLALGIGRLAPTWRQRWRATVLTMLMSIKYRTPALRHSLWRLDLAGKDEALLVSDLSEICAIEEVFGDRIYEIDLPCYPRTIVDLGANIGASVHYFHQRYPGAQILAVEADPSTYRKLVANVSALPGVRCRCLAIGDADGVATFYSSSESCVSSLTPRSYHEGIPSVERGIQVPVRRLETLLREERIGHVDLLKIDIEGAEFQILGACARLNVRALVGEIHPRLVGRDAAECLAMLGGYTVQSQNYGPNLVLFSALSAELPASRSRR